MELKTRILTSYQKTPQSLALFFKGRDEGPFAPRLMSAAEIGASTRPPTSSELYAAGRVIGNRCFDQNLEFLKCKNADANPATCLKQGEEVPSPPPYPTPPHPTLPHPPYSTLPHPNRNPNPPSP